jgi:hypothetical protein
MLGLSFPFLSLQPSFSGLFSESNKVTDNFFPKGGYASSHRLAQSINQSDACGETLQAFEVLLQFLDHPERSLSRSSMELLASRFLDNFRIVRFA